MKQQGFLRLFLIAAVLGTFVFITGSCSKDDVETNFGTVTGIVSDELGMPVTGASVTISGIDSTATTDSEGQYTINNVSIEAHSIKFAKDGYQAASTTITTSKFNDEKIATINIALVSAPAKITGTVIDARNNDAPLAGVKVSVNDNDTAVSDAEGKYEIKNLPVADYTVTFSKTDYAIITRNVSQDNFTDNVVTLDVRMGGTELLPGLIVEDLQNADKWYYNEYRGGRNSDAYPHWDWSTDYMCTLDFKGAWEEQNEGTTLQIQNSGNDQNNPADLDNFDSFVYGSKEITADNDILSLRIRTHEADDASPAYFGVQVIDLSDANPTAVKIGETKTYGSSDYADFDFDLSAYVGKEIIIAIGIYRAETGDYWKQLVLRAIRFASTKVEGTDWLPGTEVASNWHLTQEMVRSTMIQSKKSFTGISPVSGSRDDYQDAYRSWRTVNFIANEWSFVPLNKDPEVFPSEGYLIKTRGETAVDTQTPESYLYAKFAIASGNNQLTLKIRTFGSNYTFFKLTVVKEDGTVTNINPSSNTALEASAAADGCWKLIHDGGSAADPDSYATFVYDLSQFNGENVVVVLGVYKGESTNTDENKLAIYSINLD
ncbi:MAG: carboxypeptidase-like regulatory domain-containing protein [Paludibacter sp.]|nr:carboxypeptidase-like regulatory domain-containing protein [Paludibacter sp.]